MPDESTSQVISFILHDIDDLTKVVLTSIGIIPFALILMKKGVAVIHAVISIAFILN